MFDATYTAAKHIFRKKYQVYVPRTFLYGPEYIRKVGYESSGDPVVDRMAINNLSRVNQTIAGWAILHSQGAELILANEKDCIEIYKAITQHLRDWLDFSSMGIAPEYCPPIEDFRALEAIAQHYHIRVQELEPTPQITSGLKEALLSMNRGITRSSFNRTRSQGQDGSIKPYEPMCDQIERNLYGD